MWFSQRRFVFISLLALALLTSACGEELEDLLEGLVDSQNNTAESNVATIASLADDAEGDALSGSSFEGVSTVSPSWSEVGTLATCSLANIRQACSGAVMNVDWNGCTRSIGNGYTVTMTGGWTNTFNSAGTCTSVKSGGSLADGQSVTRTSSGFNVRLNGGISLTVDTSAHTNYLGTSIPSTGVTTSKAAGTTTIVINGVRRTLRGPKGTKWFEHSVTSSGVTITGTKAAGTRTASGSMTLYHNQSRYTATSTLTNIRWGSATCCYPTSGTISTAYTGTITGTSTLTYSSTCGSASFTDTRGTQATINLKLCE